MKVYCDICNLRHKW